MAVVKIGKKLGEWGGWFWFLYLLRLGMTPLSFGHLPQGENWGRSWIYFRIDKLRDLSF